MRHLPDSDGKRIDIGRESVLPRGNDLRRHVSIGSDAEKDLINCGNHKTPIIFFPYQSFFYGL